jgi:hypothetical protein
MWVVTSASGLTAPLTSPTRAFHSVGARNQKAAAAARDQQQYQEQRQQPRAALRLDSSSRSANG